MASHAKTHNGASLIGVTTVSGAERPCYETASGARYYLTAKSTKSYCSKGTAKDRQITRLDGTIELPSASTPVQNSNARPTPDNVTPLPMQSLDLPDDVSQLEREALERMATDPEAPKTTKLVEAVRTIARILDGTERADFVERVRAIDYPTPTALTEGLRPRRRRVGAGSAEDKIVVFSDFLGVLDALAHVLEGLGVDFYRLDGSTKDAERQRQLNAFSRPGSARVFLLSLKAGGAGINLQSANVCLVLDPWWSPAIERQAQDRIWRLRSPHADVFCYAFLARQTVDVRVVEVQGEKEELAARTIERVADCAPALDRTQHAADAADAALHVALEHAGLAAGCQLQPHQVFGVRWMARQERGENPLAPGTRGGLLSDDMGLGKTLQLLATIALGGPLPTLVICPLAVFNSWECDAASFFPGQLEIHRFHGAGTLPTEALRRTAAAAAEAGRKLIVLTTYETFASRSTALQPLAWGRLVLDEAHRLNNRKNGFLAAAHAAALTADEQRERQQRGVQELEVAARWCVTGTPLTNRLDDWDAQLGAMGASAALGQDDCLTERLHGVALRRTKLGVKARSPETLLPRCHVRAHWAELPAGERSKYEAEIAKRHPLAKFTIGRMLPNVDAPIKLEEEPPPPPPGSGSGGARGTGAPAGWVRDRSSGRLERSAPVD